MKKRTIAMIVCLVLTLTVSLGSTLAYLTDNDADINVMTLGHVEIVQNEQQRVENDTEFTDELEPFEDGKILLPVTKREGTVDEVTVGDHELTLSDDENNYVDKIISATNTGSVDAYVRTLVAVPTGGADWEPTPVSADNCWLHWNIPAGYDTYWTLISSNVPMIEIDGQNYYIWEFIHKDVLEEGETTFPMVRGFYMDKRVDYNVDEGYYYLTYEDGSTKKVEDFASTDTVKIYALTQAVQADGFSDATTALDAGFGDVTAVNAAKWFNGLTSDDIGSPGDKNDTNNPPKYVTTAAELREALATGGNITLGAAIDISGEGNTLAISKDAAIDLNGYKLTAGNLGMRVKSGSKVTMSNGDVDAGISGDPTIWVEQDATIEFNNVNIVAKKTGEDTTNTPEMFPLYVNGGSVVMNGGSLVNEVNNLGGWNYGVIISGGSFTMNSGKIFIKNGGVIASDPSRTASIAFATAGNTTINYNGGELDASRWIFVMGNGTVVNSYDTAFDSSKCWRTNNGVIPTFNYTNN